MSPRLLDTTVRRHQHEMQSVRRLLPSELTHQPMLVSGIGGLRTSDYQATKTVHGLTYLHLANFQIATVFSSVR